MIKKEIISRIKDSLNIVDVVGEFVTLRKAGVNYKCVCPFHDDHAPSMTVSPSRQTYHCFVCGAHGDVIRFVQEYDGKSFAEALKWCADEAKVELPEQEMTDEEKEAYKLREAQMIAIGAAARFYQGQTSQAESYLQQRGYHIGDKTLADYGIGYAPSGNAMLKTLQAEGYNVERLKDVGLVGTSEDGRQYDFFRDRLMFPFMDLHGRVVGFSGRMVTPREHTGKYVNTGETPIFNKGSNIFGLYQARKAIAKLDFVYLVEGQFDVMSLHNVGVENVVGGSGTAFTDMQIKLITRFTQRVVAIYDEDPAGQKAALKNCELLLKAGVKVQCVRLDKGQDPDDFARANGAKTQQLLINRTESFPKYFRKVLVPHGKMKDTIAVSDAVNKISELISYVSDATLRLGYIKELAKIFDTKMDVIERKVREMRAGKPEADKEAMKPGIYGLDAMKENLEADKPGIITSDYQYFLDNYDDSPVLYISGIPDSNDIQNLRRTYSYFVCTEDGCSVDSDTGQESSYLRALADIFRAGVTQLSVIVADREETFIDYYIRLHGELLQGYEGDRVPLVTRCVELTSYAEDSVITINRQKYCSSLRLTRGQFEDIRKPFVRKRKSVMAINSQSDNIDDDYDPDELPAYVEENEDYTRMLKECGYYPRLNKKGEPVCYMFRNKDSNSFTQVADFFMTPLLHIYNDDYEQNKRVLRINRRYYDTPIYIEVASKSLLKKSSIEEVLINLEAVNFTNGEERHWTKIREYMSRHFVMCTEVATYGNQQQEGTSRKTDEQFFAFANGIFHTENGIAAFEPVNELGVVTHNKKNYYLPAYSTIYAGSGRQSDKYELISQLTYREVPAEKRVTFNEWAALMNQVYKINDNGKWAIVFAVMCAFRSNIHALTRIFTAPFFMGPMSSGKTQIAISIRSLFVPPTIPVFNLNFGTDAAMSTMMGTFRDVPVVLDEYNNKDISDVKFQALKDIVYDASGKQKRKGVGGREIETDKVYTPVVICGQETPQRDDNSLMSRIIVCEVPKPRNRTPEEVRLFEHLKDIEDPNKVGLSNVLLDVLSLRPQFMDHFRQLQQACYDQLKEGVVNSGERDRLMKTASLFLGTVKLIEDYSDFELPFTYDDFLELVRDKIEFQLSLIRTTDKLALFFTAMNVMVDTKTVLEGRDFDIDQPRRCTLKDMRGNERTVTFAPGKNIMFLRLSNVFALFDRSSYNNEGATLSTIEQNLRSHPSFIGKVSSHKFTWEETVEVPKNDDDGTMIKVRKKRSSPTSAVVIDYDVFMEMYDLDLRRDNDTIPDTHASADTPPERSQTTNVPQLADLPFPPPEE